MSFFRGEEVDGGGGGRKAILFGRLFSEKSRNREKIREGLTWQGEVKENIHT